ncbi:hypothetical protein HMP0721_1461 [Pseudoramibacter alactolyticus ATCC 23263]|uniref:Uncharacterized protein n=1 Tax=Pseudoramibacter alactolyticus ATCC 23263 TaxID=887929 RepID=E6MHH6_9FIRM|nr:hypothetical protein [Pseudoramibacter alactolyticus]EFV01478.1 hypothetical protein HMP0721_1461 [Pseudoramibacter alactolyticus ATCC 23263]
MDEEKKGFVAWVKAHKKELIVAGISIGVILAVILGIKNKDALMKLWADMQASIRKSSVPVKELTDTVPVIQIAPIPEVDKSPVIRIVDVNRTAQYPFDVSDHIRNLHPGWKASAEKMAEAERLGIILQPGQTLVDDYTKGGVAA